MRISWLIALLFVTSCGTVTGQGSLPPPSPPTAALTRWQDFPAHQKPRPIIAFGNTVDHIQASGFPTNDRKIAWICNKFVLGPGVALSTSTPAQAVAEGATFPAISSARAYSDLMAARAAGGGSTSPDCAREQPFVITAVRFGSAGFPTDRGTMTMSAWLFDIPEVNAYLGETAIDPSSFWGGGLSPSGSVGGRVSSDGMTLTLGALGGPDTAGPCGEDFSAAAAESESAVAVRIATRFHTPPAGGGCTLEAHFRTVTVHLNRPLDGRVLVDERGNPGEVT